MIWALDLDDFRNRCGCEPHPLLRTINRVLRGTHGPDPGCALLSSRSSSGGIVPGGTTGSGGNTPSPINTRVECGPGEYKEHETDCSKFYQCNQNKFEERTCFAGLHWNPAPANRCDWPSNAKCQPGQSPVPSVTSRPRPTPRPTSGPTPRPTIAPTTQSTTRWTGGWTPSTTSTTIGPPITIPDTGYKVVCYFTNWAWYRQGAGKYKPEDIDAELCTHVVYGFAVLDSSRLLIKPHDTWADYDNAFYEKVTNLRKRGIKVTLAIGGWNDSLGPKYSNLVSSPAARARFNAHVVEFLLKHNFDGLDLDWEYPKCWQVDCNKGPESDKPNFTAWVRELYTAFQPHGLLLSAAVSPSFKVIDAGYEVAELNKYFDWIAVMTYDYHGHWDKATGHVAPMYHHAEGPNPKFNANFTMKYWEELGADPKKLIMGMPTYGQAFSLKSTSNTGLNSPASKGQAGKYTRAAGFLAYYEICHKIRNEGYTVVEDASGTMGPYAYKGNQWVGYDDISMIRHKSEYIKRNGYGGGMIWALDLDDFRGNCGCGTHPLLRTINQVLRNVPGPPAGCGL